MARTKIRSSRLSLVLAASLGCRGGSHPATVEPITPAEAGMRPGTAAAVVLTEAGADGGTAMGAVPGRSSGEIVCSPPAGTRVVARGTLLGVQAGDVMLRVSGLCHPTAR